MSSVQPLYSVPTAKPLSAGELDEPRWYAIQTYARNESKVTVQLKERGIIAFLPVITEMHQWSDRRKLIQLPLFQCYTFVNIASSGRIRLAILQTPGVIGFVGIKGRAIPIPDKEIDDIKSIQAHTASTPYPFLQVGNRVRIRGGSLDGLEGILVEKNADRSLVVSISLIQQSVAVRIDGYQVESI